jgi:tetratricopeptide (TPR) repeat protein
MASADQEVTTLLESGLDLYGANRQREALERWREVLSRWPDNRLAREYLEAAGALTIEPGPPPLRVVPPLQEPAADQSRSVDLRTRDLVLNLVRGQRLEEALRVLYDAHRLAPQDPSVSRSIAALKQRLLIDLSRELGSLDQVPVVAMTREEVARVPVGEIEREALRLVDGLVTYGDLLESLNREKLQGVRALVSLLRKSVLRSRAAIPAKGSAEAAPPEPAHRVPPPVPSTAPAELRFAEAVAQAVRLLIAGHRDKAKGALAQAEKLCPADAVARRNLERLKSRIESEGR